LLTGTILVLVLAALATYRLNENRGVAASDSAQIVAKTYDVGTPYAGLVVEQLVDAGDAVKKGQPLFVIDSTSLQYDIDIDNGLAQPATEATRVDKHDRLVVLATDDGTVTTIDSERGTFVQSATELAVVQRANTLYVQAEYTLTPNEYARVADHAEATVELPNHRTITATVDKVNVETVAGQAQAVVTLTGDALKDGAQNGLISAGTPVTAQLQLRNDSVVTRATGTVKSFLGRIG
jgi:multidrug resistance efflux pump